MKVLFLDTNTKLGAVTDPIWRARGGMVTSLREVPDALCRLGVDAHVISDVQVGGATDAGTKWLTRKDSEFITEMNWDFLVLNRGIDSGFSEIKAKKRILWTHDLPHNGFIPNPRTIRAFAGTVFMSRYAEAIWRTFYKTIGRSFLIPNGVDKSVFRPVEKDLDRLIFISAPNRGLKKLPLIFEALKSRIGPHLKMTTFSNMRALHPGELRDGVDQFELDYKSCEDAGIDMRLPVPQSELAGHLGRAGLMILPTGYPEICSNSILQALACGVPVVATGRLGSAPEWIRHKWNGALTLYGPQDYMVHTVEIVRAAVDILSRPDYHRTLIEHAPKTKNLFTWDEIGRKWLKMFTKLS